MFFTEEEREEFKEKIESEDFVLEFGDRFNSDELDVMRNSEAFEILNVIFIRDTYPESPKELPCLVRSEDFFGEHDDEQYCAVLLDSCGIVAGDSGSTIMFEYDEDGDAIGTEF